MWEKTPHPSIASPAKAKIKKSSFSLPGIVAIQI
jgi:hypothetical protein